MSSTKVNIRNKIRKREVYSSEFARAIGGLLPQGSKKSIAVALHIQLEYVRTVLTGNRGRTLKAENQIKIVDLAIDIVNAEYEKKALDLASFLAVIKPLNMMPLNPQGMRATA